MMTIRMEITIATMGRRTGNSASMRGYSSAAGGCTARGRSGFLNFGRDLRARAGLEHAEDDDTVVGFEPLLDDPHGRPAGRPPGRVDRADRDTPGLDLVLAVHH